jgi:hypothetical protein
MSIATASELLFEAHCRRRGLVPERLPVSSQKTADYGLVIVTSTFVIELKQKEAESVSPLGVDEAENQDGVIAPSAWVRKQIGDAYTQLRNSALGIHPTILVLYNNAGLIHWLDAFCVSKGMFGAMGLQLALIDEKIEVVRQGFFEGRKLTRASCRSLSVVAILREASGGQTELDAYHNPFASVPAKPELLAKLASAQFMHPDPHKGAIVAWQPVRLEA